MTFLKKPSSSQRQADRPAFVGEVSPPAGVLRQGGMPREVQMPRSRHVLFATLVPVLLALPAAANAQPFIRSAAPSETSQTLTINGINFGAVPPLAFLNFVPLMVQSASETEVVAGLPSAPALGPGTYSLILIVSATEYAISEVTLGATGPLTASPLGTATPALGFASAPITLTASVFNGMTGFAEPQTFRWRADPLGNNTANPGGRLDLLFGTKNVKLTPTGLSIGEDGLIEFAFGQTFPGVVKSVSAGAGLISTGPPEDVTLGVMNGGVTGAMIADGAIQTAHIANGQVGLADLAFDPATEAELDAHRGSADHDSRYYTRAEADALFHPLRTELLYVAPILDSTPTTSFTRMFTVGSFTKQRVSSSILLLWNGTVRKINFPFANNSASTSCA
ncbi:MAG: hypothetical protein ACRD3V_18145 [Vicinamibacteria bacterium]